MEKKIVLTVKKQDVKACFTCPICNNLYDHATNISECLHTFCKNLKACPVCNVDPLDKLRPDNTLDDLKLNVFKSKPETVKAATEAASTSLTYFRKKKRSYIPSLIANSSKVSTSPEPLEHAKLGEEMKAVSLNQSSSLPLSNFKRPKNNETRLEPEDPHKKSDNGFKTLLNIEQDNDLAGPSTSKGCIQKESNSGKDNEVIPISSDGLGKSLSTIDKEVAPLKSNDTALIVETAITPNAEENKNTVLNHSEGDTKEVSGEKQKNNGKEKQENVSTPRKISGKKGKGIAYSPPVLGPRRQRNKSAACTSSKAAIFMEAEKKVEGSNKKVWLSLISEANQNTDRPLLPQISNHYIRTDGNLPVSYVKKYLANKLGLRSEDEVGIWLRQEPVCSTQKLYDLVDRWVQTTPFAERKSAMVGSSGADFVMVLHYSGSQLFK